MEFCTSYNSPSTRVCMCVRRTKNKNDNDDDGRFRKMPTTIGDAKNASAATKTPPSSIRVTETCAVRFAVFTADHPRANAITPPRLVRV